MRRSHRLAAQGLLLAALAACSGARPAPSASAGGGGLPDRELGLSKTSVFEATAPPLYKDDVSPPGEHELAPRPSPELPPVIPHGVAEFLPIRAEQNGCLDCHQLEGPKKRGEATPVPASHLFDLRRNPGQKGEKVAGARWVCTACHVGRTDAPPLVGNGFRP